MLALDTIAQLVAAHVIRKRTRHLVSNGPAWLNEMVGRIDAEPKLRAKAARLADRFPAKHEQPEHRQSRQEDTCSP